MAKQYPRPARRHEQALQAYIIISSFVAHGCSGRMGRVGIITYGELAKLMGYSVQAGRTLDVALGTIARYCLANELPLLNVMVVNAETGEPGDEVILRKETSLEEEQNTVGEFGWFAYRPPSMKAFREAYENG
jgi:hypothetical protein